MQVFVAKYASRLFSEEYLIKGNGFDLQYG